MRIFKFGGASVKDADGVKNLASIVKQASGDLVIVVSAMGKTTNALEELVRLYYQKDKRKWDQLKSIKNYHVQIVNELFPSTDHTIYDRIDCLFMQIYAILERNPSIDFDFEYDQLVSFGEILSSTIVSFYLKSQKISNVWTDIRYKLKTDSLWRCAAIDWPLSEKLVKEAFDFEIIHCYVTQGFIGATASNLTTTLGREGSDYTAAVLASMLDAKDVVVWKDVPGIMNADPKIYPNSIKIEHMSYREAVELTFFGAQIIHPKTIKPLFEKKIPLFVRSFIELNESGTQIGAEPDGEDAPKLPFYILKRGQVLITISQRDFSFMDENSVSRIFGIFCKLNMKVNLFQHSALNLSISIDLPHHGIKHIIDALSEDFEVRYNEDLELLTIRNYSEEILKKELANKQIYVEQRSRKIARFLLKSI